MKDPAVLFYFQDFLVGTEFMSDEEVGKYIFVLFKKNYYLYRS